MNEAFLALLGFAALALAVLAPVVAIVLWLRVQELRGELARLAARLDRLERQAPTISLATQAQAPAQAPTEAPAQAQAPAQAPTPPPAPSSPSPSSDASAPPLDLEQVIGGRWATWAGAIAIVFAVGLLLRWSFERGLIGPAARVALGLACGGALLTGGGWLRARRAGFAVLCDGLQGAGLGALYAALFAAHRVYHFVGTAPALAALVVVTLAGIVLSVAFDRIAVATLAVLGGLLTPVLVAREESDPRLLIAYLLALDAVVAGVSRYRAWPWLTRLAWAGSALLLAPALAATPPLAPPGQMLALLVPLFLLFQVVPYLRSWATRAPVGLPDLLLSVGNGAAFYGAAYHLIRLRWPGLEGAWAAGQGLLYVLVGELHRERVPGDRPGVTVQHAQAVVMLAAAVPLLLDGPWITLVWAVQGAALLTLLPSVRGLAAPFAGGIVLLLLAAARAIVMDPWPVVAREPVWNSVFLVGLGVVAALAWGGTVTRALAAGDPSGTDARQATTLLWLTATVLLAALLWREPRGAWSPLLLSGEMLALAGIGRARRDPALTTATLVAATVFVLRAYFFDGDAARSAAGSVVNSWLAVRILGAFALAIAAGQLRDSGEGKRAVAEKALGSAAWLALLLALSLGWTDHQASLATAHRAAGLGDLAERAAFLGQAGLSALWAVYAAGTLAVGFRSGRSSLRQAGLALLALTLGKVFLLDLARLEAIYRVLSFLVLGVVLLGVAWGYQKRAVNRGEGGP